MNRCSNVSRRHFLSTTGKGITTVAALNTLSINQARSANETIGVGHIGIGVRGGTLLSQVAGRQLGGGIEGTKVVAVCDVYEPHLEKGVQRSMNDEVKQYKDYKELIADPNVDVVVIATPDHWHSSMLIEAANAKKDVYIEKGWTTSIPEAKAMLQAVKHNNIVMQLGHQSRAQTAGVQAAELIEDGLLGPVSLVRTGRFENNPFGNNIWRWYGWYNHYERPKFEDVVNSVEWDLWLGSLPYEPFNMEHFWHWRCYWKYGTGVAGDLLSHEVDFVHSVLRLGIPDTCMTSARNNLLSDGREVPDTWNSIYQYHDKNCTVTFDCSMNSVAKRPTPEFRGKEATMIFNDIAQSVTDFDVYVDPTSDKYRDDINSGEKSPNQAFRKFEPDQTPEQPSHIQDFFNCVRSRRKPKCNEDEAYIETATILMAVKSYMEKREVRWDKEKQDIV